jgi:hypothetical protein
MLLRLLLRFKLVLRRNEFFFFRVLPLDKEEIP